MTRWICARSPGYFAYYLPTGLRPVIKEVLEKFKSSDDKRFVFGGSRHSPEKGTLAIVVEPVSELYLDAGGPCIMNRPFATVSTSADVHLSVPCADIETVIGRLEHPFELKHNGHPWLEHVFLGRGLCFTPLHQKQFLRALKTALPEALERERAFMEDYEKQFPTGRAMHDGLRAGTHGIAGRELVPIHRNAHIIH